jgi:hypothetical protein
VINDVDAGRRAAKGGGIAQIPGRELDAGRCQVPSARRIANKRADVLSCGRERPREMTPGEPRCAGYEGTHR